MTIKDDFENSAEVYLYTYFLFVKIIFVIYFRLDNDDIRLL